MSQSGIKASIQAVVQRRFGSRGMSRATRQLRRDGDAARDAGHWPEAIALYERYLEEMPKDGAIWVQYGHGLKETGRLDGAEAAYLRAQELLPEDADVPLQLGHLMRVQGRNEEAARRYATALRLAPTAGAHAALVALGQGELADRTLAETKGAVGNGIYLQVNDFFGYLKAHKTVSGIQRVQLGIIDHALALLRAGQAGNLGFVHGEALGTRLWLVAPARLRAIAECVSAAEVDHAVLRRLIDEAVAGARPLQPKRGDTYVMLGAFWGLGGNVGLLRSLKQAGVRTGAYFYDLIPVTHPQYCDDGLVADFTQALYEALSLIDFGLAISDYSAREVERFARENGLPAIPVEAVPLAHSMQGIPAAAEAMPRPACLPVAPGQPYVLFVSTIEARKNHRYMFDAWKALLDEGVDVPDLIFVGRHGWRVDDLYAQFRGTAYLGGRIHVLHDLSDEEVAGLYRNCLFTVFPSMVEGWGLPIGESLSYGKLCVASNTSSMPEVGGDLVEYIDPWNLRGGIEVFRNLLRNPDQLRQREARIRAKFKPRGWDDVTRQFLDAVERLGEAVPEPRPAFIPVLPAGALRCPGRPPSGRPRAGRGAGAAVLQLRLHDHWNRPEDFGVWMEGRTGHIGFRVAPECQGPVQVYLRLRTVAWLAGNSLTVTSGSGQSRTLALPPGERLVLRLPASPGADGIVTLRLAVTGPIEAQPNDARLLSVGLEQVGYAPVADVMARTELLEALLLDRDGVTGG